FTWTTDGKAVVCGSERKAGAVLRPQGARTKYCARSLTPCQARSTVTEQSWRGQRRQLRFSARRRTIVPSTTNRPQTLRDRAWVTGTLIFCRTIITSFLLSYAKTSAMTSYLAH